MRLTRDQICLLLDGVAERTDEDRVTQEDDAIINLCHFLKTLLRSEWHPDDFVEVR